jgi:hypothetical protein
MLYKWERGVERPSYLGFLDVLPKPQDLLNSLVSGFSCNMKVMFGHKVIRLSACNYTRPSAVAASNETNPDNECDWPSSVQRWLPVPDVQANNVRNYSSSLSQQTFGFGSSNPPQFWDDDRLVKTEDDGKINRANKLQSLWRFTSFQ